MMSAIDNKSRCIIEIHEKIRKEVGEPKQVVQTVHGALEKLKNCGMKNMSAINKSR